MKCGLKEMRWNMNIEVDNVTTRVNRNQKGLTRINTSLTRINKNYHEYYTGQHESTRVQQESVDQEIIMAYRKLVDKVLTLRLVNS